MGSNPTGSAILGVLMALEKPTFEDRKGPAPRGEVSYHKHHKKPKKKYGIQIRWSTPLRKRVYKFSQWYVKMKDRDNAFDHHQRQIDNESIRNWYNDVKKINR